MEPDRLDSLETQNLDGEMQRRHHELEALSRVSAALSGMWDLDAILRVALDNLLDIMNGAIGGILLLDEEAQTLTYRVHHGLGKAYVEGIRLRLGEGIIGRVAQSGKAILLEDISTDPRVAYPALVNAEGLKAFVAVPLRAKDKVLGVINVASRTARSLHEQRYASIIFDWRPAWRCYRAGKAIRAAEKGTGKITQAGPAKFSC